jgi:2-haloacid dehalogenase
MTDTQMLRDTIKVCMFDQYGTVVDMQGGLVKIATPFLKEKGWTGNPNSFVTWWRRTHFETRCFTASTRRTAKSVTVRSPRSWTDRASNIRRRK